MGFEAVIFDLDDTLIVEERFARASLRATAALAPGLDPAAAEETVLRCARVLWRSSPHNPLCRALGIASWEALWSDFSGCHLSLDGVRHWAPAYRREAWSNALAELGIDHPALARAMADAYVEHQRAGHPLVEGAATALEAAGAGGRVGLLTNGPTDIQRLKLEQSGLSPFFDAVVISGEVGVGKPDPGSFNSVLQSLGTTPEKAVMVGDNWARDIEGALAVGMSGVWIADGRPPPRELPGVRVVESVSEALAG